jgi:FKBP-type peptidyl-prolyl cis-trans isomerase SlyD
MIVENKKVVSVNYHLTVKDEKNGGETLVEKTDAANPFVFLYGAGGLLEDFENNLKGKKVGDSFDFYITAENGYGERNDDHVVNIPIEAFKGEDGELDKEMVTPGNVLPMVDKDGNRLQGTVQEVTDTFVRMDFNHPLAGQELHFKGEVVEVREATEDELSHGHAHGPGGHHHH